MNTILDLINNIIIYNKDNVSFVIDIKGVIWFKFNDIAKIIKLKRPTDSLYLIEKEDKSNLKNVKVIKKIKEHSDTVYVTETGLYSFLIKSSMPIAKQFQLWLTKDVLPTLRKNGIYELNAKLKEKVKNLKKKIDLLTKQRDQLLKNQKPKEYPDGMYIYALKSPANELYPEMFKIGITDSLNKRISTYNSIATNRLDYAYIKKLKSNSKEIDNCIKAMLYQYRYRSNKEHFVCSLDKIKTAVNACINANKECNRASIIPGKLTDYIIQYNLQRLLYFN